jgi:HAD domain in Swiss Army Knife RNA repair proteins
VAPKDHVNTSKFGAPKPLLLVDIDGVVSLFGGLDALGVSPPRSPRGGRPRATGTIEGSFHAIDGIPHFLSSTAAGHLLRLSRSFELVWASGWEEKANEYLPHLLGLPETLPFIPFSQRTPLDARTTHAHWKLESVTAYVGQHALAWVDDAFNLACHRWASARGAPTLLVSTAPEHGLTGREARTLLRWARQLQAER